MNVSQALEQLDEIRHHLSRNEVYRGYRSRTIALTGATGLITACLLQFAWPTVDDPTRVGCWVALAAFNLAIVAWEILGDYGSHLSEHQKKMSLQTVGQFLPALCLGALFTATALVSSQCLTLLPALWAGLYAMGIFSSRPYLPRGVGWVGAFYMVASAVLLLYSSTALAQPFAMGLAFGLGQLSLAYVLYQNLERTTP